MDKATILGQIVAGNCDEFLGEISSTVSARRKTVAVTTAWRIGSKVELFGLRDNGLNGCQATITKINRSRVVVRMDENPKAGRWSGRSGVTIPMTCIRAVEDEVYDID